jgi:hypothetical protein
MGLFDVGGKVLQYGIPAAIGAYQAGTSAARQGQNPLQVLGATALGGGLGVGLGAAGGGVARYAGTKLAETGIGQQALSSGTGALMKLAGGPVAPLTAAGVGGLGALVVGQTLPALAGPLAAGTTGLIGGGAKAAVGAGTTYATTQQPGAMRPDVAVPADVQAQNKPLGWSDIISGAPAVARANEWLQAEQDRAEAVKTAQAIYPIMSQAKKDEMQRNLAAAQIRANIATNAQLMLGGAQTAQQMGLNAASQMGQALAAQYQYG